MSSSSERSQENTQEATPAKGTDAADLFDTHGFVTREERVGEDKDHQLAVNRMTTLCIAGATLFPVYSLLDWATLLGKISPGELWLIIGLRMSAGVVFGVLAWLFARRRLTRRVLKAGEVFAFTVGALLTSLIVAVTWDVVPDYYIGIGQLIIVRCVLLPGGPWRAAPVCGAMMAALPLGLWVFAGGDLGVFSGANGERVVAALSGLGGLTAVGMIGSYVYDKALQGTVVARLQDRYRLDAFLDQGGMGKVYRAWDTLLGRPCALKVIEAGEGDRWEEARKRFEQEARKTSQLRGSHVIDIFDYGTTFTGDLFYAMEFLDGEELASMVRATGPLPAERVIYLGRQACLGLGDAHGQGLLHRDVKPANLFVTHRDENADFLVVLDFGLVKAAANAAGTGHAAKLPAVDDESAAEELTAAGLLLGTPQYMAPEQILHEISDPRVDVYALGAVLYFMLTGEAAFVAPTQKELFQRIIQGPPQRPSERAPKIRIPADLEAVILRCMAFLPEDRYQTMGELRTALERCKDAKGWSEMRAVAFWRERDGRAGTAPKNYDPHSAGLGGAAVDTATETVRLDGDRPPRT